MASLRPRTRHTVCSIALIAAMLFGSVPSPAAAVQASPTPLDGDALFRSFGDQAAAALPLPTASGAPDSTPALGETISFWAWDFYTNKYYQTNATLVRQGAHSNLYLEAGLSLPAPELDGVASAFDGKVYPNVRAAFGSEPSPGVDGDARITLLLLDIRDGQYHGGGSYVTGYFSSINEFRQADLDSWFPGLQKSNQREMLYLDAAAPTEVGGNTFRFGIAHEFQHMIHWLTDQDEEPWVNEGMSDLAGYLAGFGHAGSHITAYLSDPADQLTTWSSTLADYGSAYLFLLYAWEKFGGNDLTRAIASAPGNGIAGIDEALAARGAAARFAEAFGSWTVANYLDDVAVAGGEGRYGYRTLELVDSGADGVTSFRRPKLTGDYATYTASSSGADVRAWAAQYQRFANGSGPLNIIFNGADVALFSVRMVKSTSAGFAAGTNAVETVTLNASQDGTVSVGAFGTGVASVLIVASNRSVAASPAPYALSASMAATPAPATPTPTRPPAPPPTPTQPAPTPTPAPATASLQLQAGWNLIALPLNPPAPLSAAGLVALINAQGGQATDVNRWQAGVWDNHIAGLAFTDFTVETGRGYFVRTTKSSSLTLTGRAFTSPPAVNLSSGWNLVAAPQSATPMTAEELIRSMQSQGAQIVEIDRWSSDGWTTHVTGLPLNDFEIESGQAYFVRARQPASWIP